MSWKDHVPKEKRNDFRKAFARIVSEDRLDALIGSAVFYGTKHRYCGEKDCDPENHFDDSDDRDTKIFAEDFFDSLWKDACAEAGIEAEPRAKKQKENEELSDA